MAQIRYMVDDVGQTVDFYTDILGFDLIERFGPAMAILRLGDLDLWVAGPPASARKPMPDGATPQPGGWNRFVFQVDEYGIDGLHATGSRTQQRHVATMLVEFQIAAVRTAITGCAQGGRQVFGPPGHGGNALALWKRLQVQGRQRRFGAHQDELDGVRRMAVMRFPSGNFRGQSMKLLEG